ncbi:uncharacterized protein PV09_05464 [Verruconis gallopava]|uniref:Enoyl reductase (ER) domain-containing protein n=1 Tax=Verruconis gallopava TaxID=253628 RepID=A0A0D2A901_9PEZI|nr:uncharacterized protein PV09_05464 [Verruconis gallopava]KIW03243.1 hypothetical protein PV09_05464 [Verruconis gallopava]
MPTNTAAWLMAAKTHPFSIRESSLSSPEENQILIKNHAIAINPVDGKIQALALFPLTYPTILGQDVAGEVVAVGSKVTRFAIGDRVIGCAAGFATKNEAEKAFQTYTILRDNMSSPIPAHLLYEQAVVLPLGVSTAACGLFHFDYLGLDLPKFPAQTQTGKTILVWGGASSVGSNAIQLARAAGYDVITTASPKNFAFVKNLGARVVLDYNDSNVVPDTIEVLKETEFAGVFDAIGGRSWIPLLEIVAKISAGNRFIATVISGWPKDLPESVTIKQVQALYIMDEHVGKALWEGFLPSALEAGLYLAAPVPLLAGNGIECLQAAVDLQRQGTSAKKVVVTLE